MGGMRFPQALLALVVFLALTLTQARAFASDDVAPGLYDEALAAAASGQLDDVVRHLSVAERHALRGVYVALATSPDDVLAMPACDDDGDYVVVLGRGLFDFARYVAYADASDRLRGTHLLGAYGPLLVRAQESGRRPLPPPLPASDTPSAPAREDAMRWMVGAFLDDALGFVVGDEVARMVAGEVVCPRPTVTHESGDDTWTPLEQTNALALAPSRMSASTLSAADAWAMTRLVERGGSEVPAMELLRVMGCLEDDRPQAWPYLIGHPGSRERAESIAVSAWAAREERQSAAVGSLMR